MDGHWGLDRLPPVGCQAEACQSLLPQAGVNWAMHQSPPPQAWVGDAEQDGCGAEFLRNPQVPGSTGSAGPQLPLAPWLGERMARLPRTWLQALP